MMVERLVTCCTTSRFPFLVSTNEPIGSLPSTVTPELRIDSMRVMVLMFFIVVFSIC